jgi:hypothetical protein
MKQYWPQKEARNKKMTACDVFRFFDLFAGKKLFWRLLVRRGFVLLYRSYSSQYVQVQTCTSDLVLEFRMLKIFARSKQQQHSTSPYQ